MRHVLAVDLGTSGPKVGVVDVDGRVLAVARGTTRLILGPGGAAEQDPDDWWTAITSCVRRVLQDLDARTVAGIAVTSQWSGTVPVAADGRHLGNALIWMDSRGARYVGEVTGGRVKVAGFGVRPLHAFLSRAGGLPSHSGKDPTAHILWLLRERPDVYAAARWLLEPADYLNLRLTGRACSSFDCIALHWVTDTRNVRDVRYDEGLLALSRLDRGRLPELVPSATVVGGLTREVAAEWGLVPGTPVSTASADIHSALLGSGAVADFAGHVYVGTSSWLSCHVPWKRTDVLHNQTTVPSALPGRYLLLNEHETAGACLDHLRDNVLFHPDELSSAGDRPDVYRAFDAIVARTPPGSEGVVFTPWLNGERTPVDDHTVRAGFHNISLAVTRAELVRSVYEGVAYNSRWLLEVVERFTKHRMDPLAFVGGGARSAEWAQVHADVLDRRIRRVADPQHANVRGAAILGLVALDLLDADDVDAIAARVPIAQEHVPDRRNRETYDELYRAFRQLYRRTRKIYARLNGE